MNVRLLPRVILALALVLAVGVLAPSAHAQTRHLLTVFDKVGCGTRHFHTTFTIEDGSRPYYTQLTVTHGPGRWGQTVLKNSAGETLWEFRQSYAWIWGQYGVRSPDLGAGTYSVDYWSDNLAQAEALCHAYMAVYVDVG